ncbi:mRNA splicing protein (Prp39) [Ophiocordyceps sinensis CO18]|uniref:mRNA splicing protein (Prp39) n=1 Tax=Ophiocordyceps sinensis (strain Co18 / CGMCC 3.14243) TaxID=911162 RepID=T4ZZU2_OPHSC|nr:mRNA splicing protein (Prp39) [Ophiocordyceps sinensis CO18]
MNDFGQFGGSDEEFATVRVHLLEVDADPDSFAGWENLIKACEGLEGGLSRNSSPQALSAFRDAYDRFLEKYPLFFGYWKKYAELEFNIAGTESAEMVYERGCSCVTHSVDLWTEYCRFKMDTTHDPTIVRGLFERAATYVGIDFMSHPFWDKYIEYEERREAHDCVFAILGRVIRIPLHQFNRYFDRFRTMSHTRPLSELVPADMLSRVQAEVQAESEAQGATQRPELEIERDVRAKIDAIYYEMHMVTQNETSKRWTYESELGRQFFHVTELDHAQLNNWRKYLDFEEAEGDFHRIVCLYERCLVACAMYDEFWFRYARWMSAQTGKEEETRHIYIRASFYVPVSRPGIRLQWAFFEESNGRADVAQDIHEAILVKLPDCIEVIISWAHLQRRQKDLEAAVQVLKDQIDAPTVDLYTKAALVAEWALLLWKFKGSAEQARAVFLKNAQWYGDSRNFWEKWFQFELEQPTHSDDGAETAQRVKYAFDEFRSKSRLSPAVKKELTQVYLDFLVRHGGKDSMDEYIGVDRDTFGPSSVTAASASQAGAKENGAAGPELDEASKHKAESKMSFFYEAHMEPDAAMQGPADFN